MKVILSSLSNSIKVKVGQYSLAKNISEKIQNLYAKESILVTIEPKQENDQELKIR